MNEIRELDVFHGFFLYFKWFRFCSLATPCSHKNSRRYWTSGNTLAAGSALVSNPGLQGLTLVFHPARILFKVFPFPTHHVLETHFPEIREKSQRSIEGIMMCLAISLYKAFNAIKKVLDLIPPLRIN